VYWILEAGICASSKELEARKEFIQEVTGAEVSEWVCYNLYERPKFFLCISNDGVNGTFITAHVNKIYNFYRLKQVYEDSFIVANTCMWEKQWDKDLLRRIQSINKGTELWLSKQDVSIDYHYLLHKSTTLYRYGRFGFYTSLSEREMFSNRKSGLLEAIRKSFIRVSPIILPGE